ncbi:MAG TPA: preprotein translocase subunit YajC [Pseudonocardia sp.]|nr:preprotein translocase subunit YajC [Pseudonocardia sp.]
MNNIGGFLLPLLIILMIIPMFLNGRKQKRQMAVTQELQRNLSEGDYVWTTSGLRAKVVDTSYEDSIDLEIADGLVTTWKRAAVLQKVSSDSDDSSSDESQSSEHAATNGTPTNPTPAATSEPASDSASDGSASTVGEAGASRPPHLQ